MVALESDVRVLSTVSSSMGVALESARLFAETLARAGVDYATVFARCNLGFCYYPSEVGIAHPGLRQELLGPMVEACHQRGIRVAAYINAGIDHEHALRHRDWVKVNKQGQVYQYFSVKKIGGYPVSGLISLNPIEEEQRRVGVVLHVAVFAPGVVLAQFPAVVAPEDDDGNRSVQSFRGIDPSALTDMITAINDAQDAEELKQAFAEAYKATQGDANAQKKIVMLKMPRRGNYD
jgi:hypothetical protein